MHGYAQSLVEKQIKELPSSIHAAVTAVLERYGWMARRDLLREVYRKYPWFAVNSEHPERGLVSIQRPEKAPAVYTAGYQGRSVDGFFNDLLKQGIMVLIDVRANPVSRKYGFSGPRLREFCKKLGLEYWHVPSLGIPSSERAGLNGFGSYERLLNRYEQEMLPKRQAEVKEVATLMHRKPAVLVCVEKDVRYCHRSRLAGAVASATGLEVIHL